MPSYVFSFYFPDLDPDRQTCVINTWGGHLGTALSRAWKLLKGKAQYKGIKNLCPASIGIGRLPKATL